MSRLTQEFDKAQRQGRSALIPYVTAGDPVLGPTADLIEALADAGADIVEVGIPYSDPLSDGPTIQRSGQRALANGTKIDHVLDTVARVRARGVDVPIVLLAYYNCIFRRGEEAFVQAAADAGADGLIVPDLPPEEAGSLRTLSAAAGVDFVPLAAPTGTDERLRLVGRVASGFIYCVSVTGVTGARTRLSATLPAFLENVRTHAGREVPVAVGFGISDAAQARAVGRLADGVIVGSALLRRMEEADSPSAALGAGASFVTELRAALQGTRARVG